MGHTGGPNHAMRCGGSESCTWVSCGATGWVSHMGSWCAAAMDPIEILDMKARGALPQAGQAPHACSLADTGKTRHPYFTGRDKSSSWFPTLPAFCLVHLSLWLTLITVTLSKRQALRALGELPSFRGLWETLELARGVGNRASLGDWAPLHFHWTDSHSLTLSLRVAPGHTPRGPHTPYHSGLSPPLTRAGAAHQCLHAQVSADKGVSNPENV